MGEMWRPHPEHMFHVSNRGRIRNNWGRIFSQQRVPGSDEYHVRVVYKHQHKLVPTRQLIKETWPELDVDKLEIDTDRERSSPRSTTYRKPVYCPETRKIYASHAEAARALGFSEATATRLTQEGHRSRDGYHLRDV